MSRKRKRADDATQDKRHPKGPDFPQGQTDQPKVTPTMGRSGWKERSDGMFGTKVPHIDLGDGNWEKWQEIDDELERLRTLDGRLDYLEK